MIEQILSDKKSPPPVTHFIRNTCCPSPGVQYPDGGMGFVFWEWVGGYLVMYDIMGHEIALFVPSGAFLVLVECVVELYVMLVLVYSLSL